jgi:hypothetical protein
MFHEIFKYLDKIVIELLFNYRNVVEESIKKPHWSINAAFLKLSILG